MPKRIKFFFFMALLMTSLLMLYSCGSGDTAAVQRVHPVEGIMAAQGEGGLPSIPGVPGGPTGACVIDLVSVCYQGLDQSLCDFYSGFNSVFYAGQSCFTYGYSSCVTIGAGISQCTP